jgi:DNA-binding NarL/FixJ family response regulator
MDRISIVLADEDSESRSSIRTLLESEAGFRIVGECGSSPGAIARLAALKPKILIYTISENSELQTVRLLYKKYPNVACIILARAGYFSTEEALRSGAKAVVRWNDAEAKLIKTVQDVAVGRRFAEADNPPQMIISGFITPSDTTGDDPVLTLTRREMEIFDLVVQGLNNESIASKLSISRRTVELHRANMMRKLGLQSFQKQLVSLAQQRNLIQRME